MKKISEKQSRLILKFLIYGLCGIAGLLILFEILPYLLYFLVISADKLPIPVIALVGLGIYRFFFPKTKEQIEKEIIADTEKKKKSGWFVNFLIIAFLALFMILILSLIFT